MTREKRDGREKEGGRMENGGGRGSRHKPSNGRGLQIKFVQLRDAGEY